MSLNFFKKVSSIKKLSRSVYISNNFLDRGFYKIKLSNHISNSKFTVYKSDYVVKFFLEDIPPHKLIKVLLHCFIEIFYLLSNNTAVKIGSNGVRVVIESDSLKTPINLRSIKPTKNGAKILIEEIEKTMQSNDTFLISDSLKITFISTAIDLKVLKSK